MPRVDRTSATDVPFCAVAVMATIVVPARRSVRHGCAWSPTMCPRSKRVPSWRARFCRAAWSGVQI